MLVTSHEVVTSLSEIRSIALSPGDSGAPATSPAVNGFSCVRSRQSEWSHSVKSARWLKSFLNRIEKNWPVGSSESHALATNSRNNAAKVVARRAIPCLPLRACDSILEVNVTRMFGACRVDSGQVCLIADISEEGKLREYMTRTPFVAHGFAERLIDQGVERQSERFGIHSRGGNDAAHNFARESTVPTGP